MYVRRHLKYGDVIFHNQRAKLMKLIERVQYKAALIVSGCWQGTSQDKLYDELGWVSFIKFLMNLPHPIYQITFLNEM